ncbi:MAG: hypothetical protein HQ581_25895 [Planctomycetes bacterium]|nr:hypothetical protein [Planctomycetota bacterium]
MSHLHPLAYVDPASGTILLQLIVAGAIGLAAFFRRSIHRCFHLITVRRHADETASQSPQPAEEKPDQQERKAA